MCYVKSIQTEFIKQNSESWSVSLDHFIGLVWQGYGSRSAAKVVSVNSPAMALC